GVHPAAAPLRVRRARAAHRRADDADPPRQAPPDVRDEPQRGDREGAGARRPADRAAAGERERRPGGGARGDPQQRRRALEPLGVLAHDGAGREPGRRRARGRGARGDRAELRRRRRLQEAVGRGGGGPLRLGVGVARAAGRQARHHQLPQPGQPAHGRGASRGRAARARRLGARLLPEVPEPPPRLRHRVVQRRELGRGRAPDGGEV
ncbi:MAG: Superoxide dismutase [Mn], partial [uncultured Gemmatimonadaceae bacterium]